ncbi:MAG: diacylglycerol kinase family lipid kinase [Gemmatimonadales bacterium]
MVGRCASPVATFERHRSNIASSRLDRTTYGRQKLVPSTARSSTPVPVIANPGSVRDISVALIERLLAPISEIEVRWTKGPGHARELARQAGASGRPLVVAAGGDGTVSEVASGLVSASESTSLGILPFGTGNDLARSLGLPLDLDRAAEVLVTGRARPMDLVRVHATGPTTMAISSIAGLGGDVAAGLDQELKRTWGPAAYLRMALDNVATAATFRVAITLDDERLTVDLTNVVVANGKFLGGGIPVAPLAEIDDGLLDVMVLPALPTVRLFGLVPQVLIGRHHRSHHVIHRRSRSVNVEADSPMPVTIDGEPAGSGPVSYEIEPSALRVIRPPAVPQGSLRYRI